MFFSDYKDEVKRHEPTDFEIEEVKSDPESLAYGLYSALVSYEDHYNNLQNRYKSLAITWTLATFIGIGYLVSGYEKALHINILLIVLFLSVLAAQGIFLLWFLDAGTYESLIFSIWKEIYKLEETYPSLGRSHHLVKLLFKGVKKPRLFHGVFYAYFVFFLLITGIISLGVYLYSINHWFVAFTVPLCFIIIMLINKVTRKPLCPSSEE